MSIDDYMDVGVEKYVKALEHIYKQEYVQANNEIIQLYSLYTSAVNDVGRKESFVLYEWYSRLNDIYTQSYKANQKVYKQ